MIINPVLGQMRILYAEDSRAIALPTIALLEGLGHQVKHVFNGRDAIESFETSPPDLVLMDVFMPVLDGIQACRKIKENHQARWVPLIMMTSLGAKEELVACIEAGADDYLIKPIDHEVLTAKIRSMQRIAAIQSYLYAVLENAHDGIIAIDEHGSMLSFNHASETMFGYAISEVIGRNVSMLMPSPHREQHNDYLARFQAGGEAKIIGKGRKVRGLRKDGTQFPIHLGVTQVSMGESRVFIGFVHDITNEEIAMQRIEHMAMHDVLTDLPNRAQFNNKLEALCSAGDATPPFAVIFIDLDGFKQINDQLGHQAGDQVLQIVSLRLRHEVMGRDVVARLGGDEFVALLQVDKPEHVLSVAQRLLTAITKPMEVVQKSCQVTASIGIAISGGGRSDAAEMLTRADSMMYSAKRAGKNQIAIDSLPVV